MDRQGVEYGRASIFQVASQDPDLAVNIILSGPCGVGKTTVGAWLANLLLARFVDFDRLRSQYFPAETAVAPSPFSVSYLDLLECLPAIRAQVPADFVLAIGGDTLFRRNVSNPDRLRSMREFITLCPAHVAVLTADRDALLPRYLSVGHRTMQGFEMVWQDWLEIVEPCWRQCANLWIDTSLLSPPEVAQEIQTLLDAGEDR